MKIDSQRSRGGICESPKNNARPFRTYVARLRLRFAELFELPRQSRALPSAGVNRSGLC